MGCRFLSLNSPQIGLQDFPPFALETVPSSFWSASKVCDLSGLESGWRLSVPSCRETCEISERISAEGSFDQLGSYPPVPMRFDGMRSSHPKGQTHE